MGIAATLKTDRTNRIVKARADLLAIARREATQTATKADSANVEKLLPAAELDADGYSKLVQLEEQREKLRQRIGEADAAGAELHAARAEEKQLDAELKKATGEINEKLNTVRAKIANAAGTLHSAELAERELAETTFCNLALLGMDENIDHYNLRCSCDGVLCSFTDPSAPELTLPVAVWLVEVARRRQLVDAAYSADKGDPEPSWPEVLTRAEGRGRV